jgi:hypothetical protein
MMTMRMAMMDMLWASLPVWTSLSVRRKPYPNRTSSNPGCVQSASTSAQQETEQAGAIEKAGE